MASTAKAAIHAAVPFPFPRMGINRYECAVCALRFIHDQMSVIYIILLAPAREWAGDTCITYTHAHTQIDRRWHMVDITRVHSCDTFTTDTIMRNKQQNLHFMKCDNLWLQIDDFKMRTIDRRCASAWFHANSLMGAGLAINRHVYQCTADASGIRRVRCFPYCRRAEMRICNEGATR